VGTRDRIISYLGSVTDITDPGGMASTRLAEAVGYPGSSVAFAQLLSGMERDGLISREVRGKRTYRIILAPGVQPGRVRAAGIASSGLPGGTALANGAAVYGATAYGAVGLGGTPDAIRGAVAAGGGGLANAGHGISGLPATAVPMFDYDELARRLLIQVIRRLATPPDGQEGVVADLERELEAARTRASTLSEENLALREQLSQVRRSLDEASRSLDASASELAGKLELTGAGPVGEELSHAEVVLLERLIAPTHDALDEGIQRDATAS
jgi:hypothetical protein